MECYIICLQCQKEFVEKRCIRDCKKFVVSGVPIQDKGNFLICGETNCPWMDCEKMEFFYETKKKEHIMFIRRRLL